MSPLVIAALVALRRTDRYRGLVFPVFRFFVMRRELARLKQWAETGSFLRRGLVPVWKFDGGQVLRQIFPRQLTLAVMSFLTLSAFLALGRLVGLPIDFLAIAGIVFAILSLITAGSGVKPRYELRPLVRYERAALAAAFAAVFAVHSYGLLWAVDLL